jgi:hypothetical protein
MPPWGFGGPFPAYPPPAFAMQPNQWVAPNNQQNQVGDFGRGKSTAKKFPKKKGKETVAPESSMVPMAQLNYADTICTCCGEPGHTKTTCGKPQICFICKASNHVVEGCPVLKRPHQIAKYIGSSAIGLGFYHIEMPEVTSNPVSTTRNCGVVTIEEGVISKEDLAVEFGNIYKTNWPWQIRELGDWSYLVKFPPHIPVEQVIGYPRFGLSREGVTVNVCKWEDDPEPMEFLHEVWLQIRGLLPPWCEWNVIDQAVSVCGLLKEIEWQSVFRNCAEVVRVKIVCREPSKVPAGRLFNFQGKLFHLQFTVEMVTEKNGRDGGVQNKGMGDDDLENANGGKSDDGSGANADSSKEHGNGNSSNHGANQSGNQNFQRGTGAEGSKRILHEVSVLKGEEIFSLLLQNGAIGSADQFQWVDKVSENVLQEVENFWHSEEQSFVQEMQLSVEDGQVV